jgi:hypothetical protein
MMSERMTWLRRPRPSRRRRRSIPAAASRPAQSCGPDSDGTGPRRSRVGRRRRGAVWRPSSVRSAADSDRSMCSRMSCAHGQYAGTPSSPGHRPQSTRASGSVRPREELLDRARLPDSGVADDGDELALPRRCHTQARLERTDLPLPADEEASRGADRCPGIAHGLRPSASTCPMVKNAAGSRHHSRKPAAMVASSALLAMPYSSAPLARFESVVRSAHEVAHASTES